MCEIFEASELCEVGGSFVLSLRYVECCVSCDEGWRGFVTFRVNRVEV